MLIEDYEEKQRINKVAFVSQPCT